ncbi:MAG TPA: cytochrome C [Cyclobacteriaceae bacterium]
MANHEDIPTLISKVARLLVLAVSLVLVAFGFLLFFTLDPNLSVLRGASETQAISIKVVEEDPNKIENGIHVRTGLVEAEGLMTVVNNCTSCHSSKLIIQNRMSAERWNATIRWMQQTQNLGDLGSNQEVIVNYLVANYPPKIIGRRENLTNIDWYELRID